jgi:hypothetical protein
MGCERTGGCARAPFLLRFYGTRSAAVFQGETTHGHRHSRFAAMVEARVVLCPRGRRHEGPLGPLPVPPLFLAVSVLP